MILYIKRETTSPLSVLTAVQYHHPQQWQDDKASMLLMDIVNMVVVVNDLDFSCEPAVHCHIHKGLFHRWNVLKGILQHHNLSLSEITAICFYMTKRTSCMHCLLLQGDTVLILCMYNQPSTSVSALCTQNDLFSFSFHWLYHSLWEKQQLQNFKVCGHPFSNSLNAFNECEHMLFFPQW